jgi:argininosuccinate lyase
MKGASFGDVDDAVMDVNKPTREALQRVTVEIRILRGLISTLQVNKAVMLKLASEGFSTMTELADTLVRERNISFRNAHRIVGNVVNRAVQEGRKANEVNSEMIDEAASKILGKPLKISGEAIRRALDPVENVNVRHIMGGVAPSEVRRMITNRRRRMETVEHEIADRKNNIARAREKLKADIRVLIGKTI